MKRIFLVVSEEEEELPDGRKLVTGHYKMLWMAEEFDPSSPLPHRGSCNNHGTIYREADGKTWSGAGMNHCFDEDGDSYWEYWEGNQDSGTHTQFRGTGKYRGLKGAGTWKSGIQFLNRTSMHTWALTQTIP